MFIFIPMSFLVDCAIIATEVHLKKNKYTQLCPVHGTHYEARGLPCPQPLWSHGPSVPMTEVSAGQRGAHGAAEVQLSLLYRQRNSNRTA